MVSEKPRLKGTVTLETAVLNTFSSSVDLHNKMWIHKCIYIVFKHAKT